MGVFFQSREQVMPGRGKKNHLMTARVSMLLKSRASPDMLPFSLCNKKRLSIRHMNRPPLSDDTIGSVLRYREVGRAKDLSSLSRTNQSNKQACCKRNESLCGTAFVAPFILAFGAGRRPIVSYTIRPPYPQ